MMYIIKDREKILHKALKKLYLRNIPIKKLARMHANEAHFLPRLSNGQYLPEVQDWLRVRREDRLNSRRPYLFFNPLNGYRLEKDDILSFLIQSKKFVVKEPPTEMLNVIRVFQYYCGLKYKHIHKLKLEDYDSTKRTLTIRNFSKKDNKYFTGSPDVVRYRDDNIIKFRLPKYLGEYINKWLFFRGMLRGNMLWRMSKCYCPDIHYEDYMNWLFTFMPKPDNFMTMKEAAAFLGCHIDTIYKSVRKGSGRFPAIMYKNTLHVFVANTEKETIGFPELIGDF